MRHFSKQTGIFKAMLFSLIKDFHHRNGWLRSGKFTG